MRASSAISGSWRLTLGEAIIALVAAGSWSAARAEGEPAATAKTATPIEHLIVLIGENHSFDNVFATYRSQCVHFVSNLLSKRVVNPDGMSGRDAAEAAQFFVNTPLPATYFMGTGFTKTPYSPFLPTPELGGAPNQPTSLTQILKSPTVAQPPFDNTVSDSLLAAIEPALKTSDLFLLRTGATGAAGTTGSDTRVPHYNMLPNTVFQLTGPALPYDSYTGNLVHRFYQMWQQSDCNVKNATRTDPAGCLEDLYPYVGIEREVMIRVPTQWVFSICSRVTPRC